MESGTILAERDDVQVRVLEHEQLDDVLDLLREGERTAGAPLVDEAEQQRLLRLAEDATSRPAGWTPVVATRGGAVVGYGALVAPGHADGPATGDAAPSPLHEPTSPTLAVLLDALEVVARGSGADRLQIWVRSAGQDEVEVAAGQGFGVERRLGVLGRSLDRPPTHPASGPAHVRAFRPGADDEAVVEVLAAAYADTPEAGWDAAQLRDRQGLPWFRAEDLLLAELPAEGGGSGGLAGIHWLKRREPGVGEVYNLAIHPEAQGSGVGAQLLGAGLDHLASIGCREVVLWVDLDNERAVRLYASQGFATRWQDLGLTKTLVGG
jgi:mycothiol synthase